MFAGDQLFAAAEAGDVEKIEAIVLRQPASVNFSRRETAEQTALFAAAFKGHTAAVDSLLRHGADPNKRAMLGRTPLLVAAEAGHRSAAALLIDSGANVNAANDDGRTPLVVASRMGHLSVVQLLLEHGADVRLYSHFGRTAVFAAAWNGNVDVVELLLQHGADPQQADRVGRTPLFVAASEGHLEVVRLLLFGNRKVCVDYVDKDGWTALHEAAGRGRTDTVKLLLDAGADIRLRLPDSGATALHIAAANGQAETVAVLIGCGADADALDNVGQTPLVCAVQSKRMDAVTMLALCGARIGVIVPEFRLAGKEMIELLQSLGAQVGVETQSGLAATILLFGDPDTVEMRQSVAGCWDMFCMPDVRIVSKVFVKVINGLRVSMQLVNNETPATGLSVDKLQALTRRQLQSKVSVNVAIIFPSNATPAEENARSWQNTLLRCGFQGTIALVSSSKESRSVALGQGMLLAAIDDPNSSDCVRAIIQVVQDAIALRFSPGRRLQRSQALAIAQGLHPRLGEHSPLSHTDQFVIHNILDLVGSSFFPPPKM